MSKLVYLDNAATSFPKPSCLVAVMEKYLQEPSLSPYRFRGSLDRPNPLSEARQVLASFLGAADPDKISFTHNATYAINTLLKGFLRDNDHVIISNFEHNAVLRPLYMLRQSRNISWSTWLSDSDGFFDLRDLERLTQPNTRLIFLSHASNVLGTVIPMDPVASFAKSHGIALGIDCTQTAGHIPVHADKWGIDLLAGTGHKGLLGPSGVGYLYVRDCERVDTFVEGGGGFLADVEMHPAVSPHKYEAGTPNYVGIAGLHESLKWLKAREDELRNKQQNLLAYLLERLSALENVVIYGTRDVSAKIPLVSFNIKNRFGSQVEEFLLRNHQIVTRSGLHCAPLTHRHLGTLPRGALRVSLGPYNIRYDVDRLMAALAEL